MTSGKEIWKETETEENAAADSGALLRHGAGPFDIAPYMDDLKDMDITEEQKVALLQTLCLIMKTFVDIGWGVDSVQRVFPALMDAPQADEPPSTKEERD